MKVSKIRKELMKLSGSSTVRFYDNNGNIVSIRGLVIEENGDVTFFSREVPTRNQEHVEIVYR